jgi:hypothetical protein
VVGTSDVGVLVCAATTTLGELLPPAQIVKLTTKDPTYLVLSGSGWSEELARRALETAEQGYYPWLCQRCAGCVCGVCGAPLEHPVAWTLNDDGAVNHLRIVRKDAKCINPACGTVVQLR